MMSKHTPFLFFIILIVSTMPLSRADALGIGPASLELDVLIDGSNSTTIYFNSDGVTGELIIGKEDLPFRMEPSRVNMTSGDVSVPVELTFYGNETLEPGVYEGKVTFIAYSGGFVAVGIKIRAKINLIGEVPEIQEEEPETPVEEELEAETEGEPEPEEEPETDEETDPAIETYDAAQDAESAEEPKPESQEIDYLPYVMGVAAVAALVAIVIWWKRR